MISILIIQVLLGPLEYFQLCLHFIPIRIILVFPSSIFQTSFMFQHSILYRNIFFEFFLSLQS